MSLTFITFPSIFVGVAELIGYPAFTKLGPFYLLGLVIAGEKRCKPLVVEIFDNSRLFHLRYVYIL